MEIYHHFSGQQRPHPGWSSHRLVGPMRGPPRLMHSCPRTRGGQGNGATACPGVAKVGDYYGLLTIYSWCNHKNGDFPLDNWLTGWCLMLVNPIVTQLYDGKIPIYMIWLVVKKQSWKIKSWEGWHPIYEMKNNKCSKPPTR